MKAPFRSFNPGPFAALLSFGVLATAMPSRAAPVPVAEVEVSNPSKFARKDEPVHLAIVDLGLDPHDDGNGRLVASIESEAVPGQVWDRDGDGVQETFTVLVDLEPAETILISVKRNGATDPLPDFPHRVQAEVSRKFGGEWQDRKYVGGNFANVDSLTPPPEHTDHSFFIRYEGPGWESDKVGYRFYLDWRNGFDVFGKLKPDLVLQDVGQDGFDSYHEPADWGMDILKVGSALGSGGFGHWDGEKVIRVSETSGLHTRVVENGPALAQLKTRYSNWNAGTETLDITSQLTIAAGSRITMARLLPETSGTTLCAGLVKNPEAELITGNTDIPGFSWTYLATYGKQTLFDDDLGLAILFRKMDLKSIEEDEYNHVVVFRDSASGVGYGFLAAWEREPGGISSREEFIAYLDRETERLTLAPRVRIKSALNAEEKEAPLNGLTALNWSTRFADSAIRRRGESLAFGSFDSEANAPAKWTYTTGLMSKAIHDTGSASGRADLETYAERLIDSYITAEGDIKTYKISDYNIDKINSGKMLLELADQTGETRYMKAAGLLRQQLRDHPKTKGGAFWHKKIYPSQLWLDGVYMAAPFLARYGAMNDDDETLAEVLNEFLICEAQLRDPQTGLYYHAWDESRKQPWADKTTGQSSYFWGRGLGWFAMALVDTHDFTQEGSRERNELERLLRDLAEALIRVQDPESGVWFQILDQSERVGNYRESSASSMFVYALAKAVNKGILDNTYIEPVLRGYEGLINEFVRIRADGTISLDGVCRVAGLGFGRDGSYHYYMSEPVVANDPKGAGPFMMAGVEVHRMLSR